MKKFIDLLGYELKNLTRDSMTMILIVYPIMIVLIGSYIIPMVLEQFGEDGVQSSIVGLVIVIIFASIAPFITGAMLGFNILDHRDENTLDTIRVTPLSLKGYMRFKSIYAYVLCVMASFVTVYGVKVLSGDRYTVQGFNFFDQLSVGMTLTYALVAGLFAPMFGLFLGGVAKNKIEGFAYMKTFGIFAVLPGLLVINALQDWKQYLLGVIPTFWPVKGLMVHASLLNNTSDLPVWGYHSIGVIFMAGLTIVCYRYFESKIQA